MPATTLRRSARKLAVTAAVAGSLFAGVGTAQAASPESITDDYLYSKSLPQFTDLRASKPHADVLDWSSDSCSYSPDNPLGFKFTPACDRHDFGYRNYKKQSRFNEDNRKKIDDNFYDDLKHQCNGNTVCNGLAWTYYQAVRKFGQS